MSAGGKLETLGTAGLGKAGQKAVNNAVDSIGNFIVRYETCLKTPDKVETVLVTGQDGTQRATFKLETSRIGRNVLFLKSTADGDMLDGDRTLVDLVNSIVSGIEIAKSTGLSDKAIRDALNARYQGNYSGDEYMSYRYFGGVLQCWIALDDILSNVDSIIDVVQPIAKDFGLESQVTPICNKIKQVADNVRTFKLLFPIQGHDFFMVADKAVNIVGKHFMLLANIVLGNYPAGGGSQGGGGSQEGGGQEGGGSQEGGGGSQEGGGGSQGGGSQEGGGGSQGGGSQSGGGTNPAIQELAAIPDKISQYVGNRTYQTVGDKLAVCLIYDVLDAVKVCLDRYVQMHPDEELFKEYADLTYKWVLANCGAQLDRVMADLTLLAYIYDIRLDVAGIVGGLLPNG